MKVSTKIKFWGFFASLLNMISKRRVIRHLKEGGRFLNNISWIKKKHFFSYQTLDPNDRIWTIHLKNRSSENQTISLFGAIYDPFNKKMNDNVEIKVSESSYDSIKADLLTSMFHVQGIKVIVNDTKQLASKILLQEHESTGSICSRVLTPLNYRTKNDMHQEMIEIDYYWMRINKNTLWVIELLPNIEMTIILQFFAKITVDRTLFNFKDIYNYPKTHGGRKYMYL